MRWGHTVPELVYEEREAVAADFVVMIVGYLRRKIPLPGEYSRDSRLPQIRGVVCVRKGVLLECSEHIAPWEQDTTTTPFNNEHTQALGADDVQRLQGGVANRSGALASALKRECTLAARPATSQAIRAANRGPRPPVPA